jgi:hypothetical protein
VGNDIAHLDRLAQLGRFVHTPGSKCVSLLLSAYPVTIQQFRLPPDLDRSAFVAGVPLVELESIVADGEPIFESPDDQIIREFECAEGDAWMLRLTYKPFAIESWIFDKDTLRSVFPAAVRPETSSLVSLCQVFGATQDADAAPFVLELARHEAHFVRWAAIQAMGRIDGDAARQLLGESCEDPHPHIQAAARKTLERIGA